MAYGKIKADAFIFDDNGDTEITMATIATNSSKADTGSPTFTGTVNLPATTNFAGASTLEILDNNANAFGIDEGVNNYVNFDTTDGSEQIEVAKNVELAGNLEFTASADLRIKDGAATAFQVKQGSSNYVTFDTDTEQVELNKKVTLDGDLQFMVASDILMTDNSSTALEVKEGSTSYMTFDTTNSAEQVEVNVPLVLNNTTEIRLADSDSSNFIALKAPDTVTSNVTLKLPADDGDANEVLKTNGSGVLSWGSVTQVLKKIHYHEFSTRVASVSSQAGDKMTFVSNFQPLDPENNDLFFHIVIPADGAGNNWSGAGIRFEGNGSSTTDFEKYEGMCYPGPSSYSNFYIHSFRVPAGTFSGTGSDTFSLHHHLDNAHGSNIEDYNPNSSDEQRVSQQTVTTVTVWEYANS